jgi:hypothetical protein
MRTVSLTPHMKADIMRLRMFTATIDARIARPSDPDARRSAGGVEPVIAMDERDRDRENTGLDQRVEDVDGREKQREVVIVGSRRQAQ